MYRQTATSERPSSMWSLEGRVILMQQVKWWVTCSIASAGVICPVPWEPPHLQGLPVATDLFKYLSIVSFFQLLKRVHHLQGVASGLFKHLSIVCFFPFQRLSAQASRLPLTGATVKSLQLWLCLPSSVLVSLRATEAGARAAPSSAASLCSSLDSSSSSSLSSSPSSSLSYPLSIFFKFPFVIFESLLDPLCSSSLCSSIPRL